MKLRARTLIGAALASSALLVPAIFVHAGSKEPSRVLQHPSAASARASSTVAGGAVELSGHAAIGVGTAVSLAGMASVAAGEGIAETGTEMREFGRSPLPLGIVEPARTPDPAPKLN